VGGGGAIGVVVPGGLVNDDGIGGRLSTTSQAAIYIWDVSGAGTCRYRYIEETW
jgi:hypothetical protein